MSIDTEKMCSGCGRLESDVISPPALACCPELSFRPIPTELIYFIRLHKKHSDELKKIKAIFE